MEAVNGVSEQDKGGPPPPSPLTGCYLLIVIGEPHCSEHKDIILQRVAKGLLSWEVNDCLVDLEKELAIITEQALEGEEARYGERLIQFASENLVTEILIHPVVSTLIQCIRNLLSSFTRHRHIIHAGYTFANNGSWVLQDGTFSLADFTEACQEIEVLRLIRAYENSISMDIHCAPEGDWTRLPKDPLTKSCKVRINPDDVLTSGSSSITAFINYISPFLVPAELEQLLESSDVVGNIRFSRPTLYVFPGGQGDAALFGINGFNMLLDGGFSRKACFWDFVRHLDRLDAVLLTRLNNSNVNGISAVLKRKKQNAVYPQIGHFFCNIQERKAALSPDGDKDKDPLLINLLEEGQNIVSNLHHLNLTPQVCYRDSEPINLYHKVGHGTLDMYVLSPAKDSKEVKEFLQKWNNNDQKLFATAKTSREFTFPLQNIVSICALLVWQPANPEDTITRILFPGSSPQNKIFDGLDKIKNLEFIRHSVCSEKSLTLTTVKSKQSKDAIFDKIIPLEKKIALDNNKKEKQRQPDKVAEDIINETELKNGNITNGVQTDKIIQEKIVKKSDSTDSEKSVTKPRKMIDITDKIKTKTKIETKTPKTRSTSQQRKIKSTEKKSSPPTPKKTVDKVNGEVKETTKLKTKASPRATPAKSTKDANNRKVLESKIKAAPKKETHKPVPEKKEAKTERKPISRRPKETPKMTSSPSKKVNGIQKPDSISRRSKFDKEGTTDSSAVSTPSADQENILKKDISKFTSEEMQHLKAEELADLKEEQEAVKEIEAVFMKSELIEEPSTDMRKIKDISIDDKLESEEYIIIEKTEIEQDSMGEKEIREDETQKLTRDSEESEKQRKLSGDIQKTETEECKIVAVEEIQKTVVTTYKEEAIETSKEASEISPEDKIDVLLTDKKTTDKDIEDEQREVAPESQPDEKVSAIESGATTTAPTLPEDERIPLDEIKEDRSDQVIEEKHVKEETKEKEVPSVQVSQKIFEAVKLPPVIGIKLNKQAHIRDIVKTPDEVADLPMHEEADYNDYANVPEGKTPDSKDSDQKDIREEVKVEQSVEKVTTETRKEEMFNGISEKHEDKDKLSDDSSKLKEDVAEKEIDKKIEQNVFTTSDKDILKPEKDNVIADLKIKLTDQELDGQKSDYKIEEIEKDTRLEITEISKENLEVKETIKEEEIVEKAETEVKEKELDKQPDLIREIQEKIDEKEKEQKLISEIVEDTTINKNKIIEVKEDLNEITKTDEKLQQLKDNAEKKRKDSVSTEIIKVDRKIEEKPEHAESVVIPAESQPDSPTAEDKLPIRSKSPKEREEDVVKIVATVAEVLKSDAPLEEFEGKIPFTTYQSFPTYTTELRETHITTLDSPVTDEIKLVKTEETPKICEKTASYPEEERRTSPVEEEKESKTSNLMKDAKDLIEATSKIILDIKQKPSIDIIKEEQETDSGIVHRMLVTTSSEDGGEEIEICPAGTITFSKSSESSGRSSPEQKQSQISSIDTVSESLSTIKAVVIDVSDKDSGIEDLAKDAETKHKAAEKESKEEDKDMSKKLFGLVEEQQTRRESITDTTTVKHFEEKSEEKDKSKKNYEVAKMKDKTAIKEIEKSQEQDEKPTEPKIKYEIGESEKLNENLKTKIEVTKEFITKEIKETAEKLDTKIKSTVDIKESMQDKKIVSVKDIDVMSEIKQEKEELESKLDDFEKNVQDIVKKEVTKLIQEKTEIETKIHEAIDDVEKVEKGVPKATDGVIETASTIAEEAIKGVKELISDKNKDIIVDTKKEINEPKIKITETIVKTEKIPEQVKDVTKETDKTIEKGEVVKAILKETKKLISEKSKDLLDVKEAKIETKITEAIEKVEKLSDEVKEDTAEETDKIVKKSEVVKEVFKDVKEAISEKNKDVITDTKKEKAEIETKITEAILKKEKTSDQIKKEISEKVEKQTDVLEEIIKDTQELVEKKSEDLVTELKKQELQIEAKISEAIDDVETAFEGVKESLPEIAKETTQEAISEIKDDKEHIEIKITNKIENVKKLSEQITEDIVEKVDKITEETEIFKKAIEGTKESISEKIESKLNEVIDDIKIINEKVKKDIPMKETAKDAKGIISETAEVAVLKIKEEKTEIENILTETTDNIKKEADDVKDDASKKGSEIIEKVKDVTKDKKEVISKETKDIAIEKEDEKENIKKEISKKLKDIDEIITAKVEDLNEVIPKVKEEEKEVENEQKDKFDSEIEKAQEKKVKNIEEVKEVKKILDKAKDSIQEIVKEAKDVINKDIEMIKDKSKEEVRKITDSLSKEAETLKETVETYTEQVTTTLTEVKEKVKDEEKVDDISKDVSEIKETITEKILDEIIKIDEKTINLKEELSEDLNQIEEKSKKFMGEIKDFISNKEENISKAKEICDKDEIITKEIIKTNFATIKTEQVPEQDQETDDKKTDIKKIEDEKKTETMSEIPEKIESKDSKKSSDLLETSEKHKYDIFNSLEEVGEMVVDVLTASRKEESFKTRSRKTSLEAKPSISGKISPISGKTSPQPIMDLKLEETVELRPVSPTQDEGVKEKQHLDEKKEEKLSEELSSLQPLDTDKEVCISGRSTPEKQDTKETSPRTTSGKSTPEKLDAKLTSPKLSGKSTPEKQVLSLQVSSEKESLELIDDKDKQERKMSKEEQDFTVSPTLKSTSDSIEIKKTSDREELGDLAVKLKVDSRASTPEKQVITSLPKIVSGNVSPELIQDKGKDENRKESVDLTAPREDSIASTPEKQDLNASSKLTSEKISPELIQSKQAEEKTKESMDLTTPLKEDSRSSTPDKHDISPSPKISPVSDSTKEKKDLTLPQKVESRTSTPEKPDLISFPNVTSRKASADITDDDKDKKEGPLEKDLIYPPKSDSRASTPEKQVIISSPKLISGKISPEIIDVSFKEKKEDQKPSLEKDLALSKKIDSRASTPEKQVSISSPKLYLQASSPKEQDLNPSPKVDLGKISPKLISDLTKQKEESEISIDIQDKLTEKKIENVKISSTTEITKQIFEQIPSSLSLSKDSIETKIKDKAVDKEESVEKHDSGKVSPESRVLDSMLSSSESTSEKSSPLKQETDPRDVSTKKDSLTTLSPLKDASKSLSEMSSIKSSPEKQSIEINGKDSLTSSISISPELKDKQDSLTPDISTKEDKPKLKSELDEFINKDEDNIKDILEKGAKEVKDFIKEKTDAISSVFRKTSVEEEILKKTAQDIEENYETVTDLSKSIVFEKYEKSEVPETVAEVQDSKVEMDKILEKAENDTEAISDMSKSIIFEKSEEDNSEKAEAVLERAAHDIEDNFKVVTDMSQSIIFEKCEKHSQDKEDIKKAEETLEKTAHDIEDNFQTVSDMSKSIIFDKVISRSPKEASKDIPDSFDIVSKMTESVLCEKPETIIEKIVEISDGNKEIKETICETIKISGKTETITESVTVTKIENDVLDLPELQGKKLSISDVKIEIKDLDKKDYQESHSETKDIDSLDSGIGVEAESTTKSKSEMLKDVQIIKETSTFIEKESYFKEESIPGPSSIPADKSPDNLSGKSTPDIADVEKMRAVFKPETHISGNSTPPTVPVSPVMKEATELKLSKTDTKKSCLDSTIKESEVRSATPGSDCEVSHSDISSEQVSRMAYLESGRIDSDEDEIPGSPLSITSQVAHSRSSSHYDFDDDRMTAKMDPMSMSFYGALPDDPKDESDLEFEKAMVEHRQVRGEDLVVKEGPSSYLYEVTKAKFTSANDEQDAGKSSDLMTASFIGTELPTNMEKDPIESWGKPLGLPSPAPPNDNKGTPKKERKLPSNVSAKNKLNDDKKRSVSPSKIKKINPIYVDLTYVPHHGNSYYTYVDFFKRIRARYYVFSGTEPSREVYNALLEAKQTWEDKDLEVTIIPTYDTDILGYWVADNEELLAKYKIDLSPSASRCTINLQDHETSCSAYRLEF